MHSDPFPTTPDTLSRVDQRRMRGTMNGKQSDGRSKLPHIITGLLSVALTLLIGKYAHIAQGQQGPPGVTSVITHQAPQYGVCFVYSSHASGSKRFQLVTPQSDKNGMWCKAGKLVYLTPTK